MHSFLTGNTGRFWSNLPAVSLLLVFFARLLHTASQIAATFDELLHLLGSAVYWQHRPLLPLIDNPLLIHALIGLPLRLLSPVLPVDHPYWGERFASLALSTEFVWAANDNGLLLVWVGRLAVMLLALLLAALAWRWSGRLGKSHRAARVTLFLVTFDPNILAHASLATTDIGTAFFVLLAAYLLWGYWQEPGRRRFFLAGLGLGLALSSKYSALALFPAAGLMTLWVAQQRRPGWGALWRAIGETAGWSAIALLVLLAVQQFNIPILLTNLEAVRGAGQFGHPTYLLGRIQQGGWWYYFPVIFLAKTPVAVFVLVIVGVGVGFVKWTGDRRPETADGGRRTEERPGTGDRGPGVTVSGRRRTAERLETADGRPQTAYSEIRNPQSAIGNSAIFWPLLLIVVWVAVAMVGRINVGYRQLLPVLPLLYILLGQLARPGVLPGKVWPVVYALSLAAFALVSLLAHPHYLAYFNLPAGGPENGWRIAVDSNLDWGQDLNALAGESAQPFYSALLSTSPPAAYGFPAEQLPVWPLPADNPQEADFYPSRPGTGRYAISATQLAGLYLNDQDTFAYFRDLEPAGRAGYSIFLYDVPAEGVLTGLALSGAGLPEIDFTTYNATLDSNQLALRRYDARRSFIWPPAERHWAAVAATHRPEQPLLADLYPPPRQIAEISRPEGMIPYDLYSWPESPLQNLDLLNPPGEAAFRDPRSGRVALVFQGHTPADFRPGAPLEMVTVWEIAEPPGQPFQLFLHLVNEQGEIVAQHDGWDIQLPGLAAGDMAAQLHQLFVPAELPAGSYFLRLGVYYLETGDRFLIETQNGPDDYIQLMTQFMVK